MLQLAVMTLLIHFKDQTQYGSSLNLVKNLGASWQRSLPVVKYLPLLECHERGWLCSANRWLLTQTSNAKEKAELFCSQYFLSLQTEEAVALGLATLNTVQEQYYLYFSAGQSIVGKIIYCWISLEIGTSA